MIRKIFLILFLCSIPLFFNKELYADEPEQISIINLIATPEKYEGKLIMIFGYVKLEFEATSVYLTKSDMENYICKNGLWLNGIGSDEWKKYDGQLCLIEGIFDSTMTGHMGACSGGIKNVSRLQVWNIEKIAPNAHAN